MAATPRISLGPGHRSLIISFLLALFFSADKGFPGTAWAYILAGPLTAGILHALHWSTPVGWLGLILVWAHPIRPHPLTGLATGLGLALWCFAGLVTYMRSAWG